MGSIRWTGTALGASATGVLGFLFLALASLVLDPFVSSITGTAPVDGVTSITAAEERVRGLLTGAFVISSLLLCFFIGGLVAGRCAISHAGLNGAVVGIVILAVPFLSLLVGLGLVLLEPVRNPGDVYTRAENIGMLGAALVVYSVISPVMVLSGFLGGRVGGRSGSLFGGNNRQGV
ncbi:MAG: hypothetical protein ACFB50_17815 [Rubrobacteraceae bacterium]